MLVQRPINARALAVKTGHHRSLNGPSRTPGDIVTRRPTEARPTFKTRPARLIPSTRLWISCSTRDGVRDSTVPSVVDPRVGAPGHANPPSGAGTLLTHGGTRQADVRSGVPSSATIRADHDHHIWCRHADVAHMLWCPANTSSILPPARMRTGARVRIRVQTNAKHGQSRLI